MRKNRNGGAAPYALRVSHRRTIIDSLTKRRVHSDHVLIKCGDCDEKMEIFPDDRLIEIGGVIASIEEWRAVLLPLLGVEGYERYPDIDKAISDCAAGHEAYRAKRRAEKDSYTPK